MRAAILSDIHANLHALQAVAKDVADQRVDEVWCLGDVVGYGANPRETLAWVLEHANIVIKGNHDEAVATGDVRWFNPMAAQAARAHAQSLSPPERNTLYSWPSSLQRDIDIGVGGGGHSEKSEHRKSERTQREGAERTHVLLVHASPDDPLHEYVQPQDARLGLRRWEGRARLILLGHTHRPFAATLTARNSDSKNSDLSRGTSSASSFSRSSSSHSSSSPALSSFSSPSASPSSPSASSPLSSSSPYASPASRSSSSSDAPWRTSGFSETLVDERPDARPLLLVNPGSVGQPRDGDPRASYAIVDFAARTVELRRVAYDIEAAAQAIVKEGLDQILALRLYEGR